jgi:hypothetical protein
MRSSGAEDTAKNPGEPQVKSSKELRADVSRPAGMARQGYDLQLTRYNEKGWRAIFYTSGMEPSPTSAMGTGWSA